jgi:hypothetical protein
MNTTTGNMNVTLSSNLQSCYIGDPWPLYPSIQPLVQTYYPTYYGYWNNESNIEKAFLIVQKLMNKKIVNPLKIKDFIELVNEIASVI